MSAQTVNFEFDIGMINKKVVSMKIQRAVALRISNLLIKNNMNQYQLSKRMLTDQSTIKHIIHEEYKSIKFDTLIKIADGFEMTVQEFLNDDLFARENLDVE